MEDLSEQRALYNLPPDGNQTTPEGQIGAMVPLSYIVYNLQNDMEDYTTQQYKRLLQIVINGVRHLRLYGQPAIQVYYAQINEAGIIKLPPDYLDYTKIGLFVHGQVVTLTVNNNMALNRAQECAVDIRTMYKDNGLALNSIVGGYYFTPHYYQNQYVGGLYGVGGGFNVAYYRVDKQANQIQFDGVIRAGQVVIEYESTGISVGTLVPAEMIEPLKTWTDWQKMERDDRVSLSVKKDKERQFGDAVRSLRSFNNKFTKSEYLDTLYRHYKQSPKH